jgi:hypothetical protein
MTYVDILLTFCPIAKRYDGWYVTRVMKLPIKLRKRRVKKAVLVSIYALAAVAMIVGTVAPGLGK